MIKCLSFLALFITVWSARGQGGYQAPQDTLVIRRLARWQDYKFGLFMHWGPYSQWGVAESWTICPDDWVKRSGPYSENYFEYKKAYENLPSSFNPVAFDPAKWAAAAREAGMRYMVFTTKHHDGFCMFNTSQTEYRITSAGVPFSGNPRSNITREIFDAFRKDSFLIGAYFSKPDWHSEYFWWPYFPPKDHNVNYSTAQYPDRWQKFCDLTYDQIEELMTGYGKVDILWLDGGWVRPPAKANDPYSMDLHMDRIAGMARQHQPGLIIVDRTVGGAFENYLTPEQEVPDKPLPYPWETCMTMGTSWSYSPGDKYKSVHDLLTLLIRIVSRGGNFLLNVGPDGNGDWDPVVYQRLKGIGEWMKINGEGIYGTRPAAPYSEGNMYFTMSGVQPARYIFWLSPSEEVALPSNIDMPMSGVSSIRSVELLGTKKKLRWRLAGGRLVVLIPPSLQKQGLLKHSAVFKVSY